MISMTSLKHSEHGPSCWIVCFINWQYHWETLLYNCIPALSSPGWWQWLIVPVYWNAAYDNWFCHQHVLCSWLPVIKAINVLPCCVVHACLLCLEYSRNWWIILLEIIKANNLFVVLWGGSGRKILSWPHVIFLEDFHQWQGCNMNKFVHNLL